METFGASLLLGPAHRTITLGDLNNSTKDYNIQKQLYVFTYFINTKEYGWLIPQTFEKLQEP